MILLISIVSGLGMSLWLASRIQSGVRVIVERLTTLREQLTTDLRAGLTGPQLLVHGV